MFLFSRIKKGENKGKMVLIWSRSTIFLVWEAKVVSCLRPSWACNFAVSSVLPTCKNLLIFQEVLCVVFPKCNSAVCCILCGFKISSFIF